MIDSPMTESVEATMPAPAIFPVIPETRPPVAESIAAGLLREVEAEAARRVGQHIDWWRAFWQSSEATPEQIAAAMNGSAALFFGIASVNKGHIIAVAQMLGKTPEQLGVPTECLTTPREVTINPDGSVTIGE
jgi:hypothetical protein